jgi:hypothetical protein
MAQTSSTAATPAALVADLLRPILSGEAKAAPDALAGEILAALDQAGLLRNVDADINWPLVHSLAKPTDVFGTEVRALTLREPTGADFLKFGVLDDRMTGDSVADMIAQLSGHTPLEIRKLPGLELLRLTNRLMRFFAQAAR